MSPSRHFLAIFLFLLTAVPSGAVHAQTTAIDSIVAVIDEDVILRSELEQAVANIKAQYAKQSGQLPPENILERQVLERLILQRLQINRAKEIGVRVSDAELVQVIDNIAKSNNMSQAQFEQRLKQEGLAFEDYRNNLRDELMQQRLRQSYVQSRVQVSEAEVDQYVAREKSAGPEVLLANILVALPENPTPDQIETAKRKIDGILDLIRKGTMTFQAAAIRYSDAQNALDGGQIGWRTMDSIPAQFTTMLAQMKAGDITEAVRGPSGYQLIQVADVRDSQAAQVIQEYRAQAILIDPNSVGGNEVARQRAEELRERVGKGEDFGKLAKEFSSEDMNAGNGGMLDWFSQNQWGSSVANQIVLLKDGDVSPVLQTDAGFLFIKRLGTRTQDANAENKKRKARETIGQRKADEEYERFLRQLRAEAFVESRLAAI
jgi:peptidyl-prolyl cis-trans isomerase SurA